MRPTDEQMAGFLIVLARSSRGLSQRAFAERVGITQPVLSRYESGRQQPTLPMLLRLVHGAGLELRMELTEPPPRAEWEIAVAEDGALRWQDPDSVADHDDARPRDEPGSVPRS